MAADLASARSVFRRGRPFGRRFQIALGVLALLLAAAIGATVWVATDTERPKAFSSFTPNADDPVERAQQVADYVSARYASEPGGPPLVTVQAGEDDKAALPGAQQAIAVGTNPPGVVSFEYGDILFYRMCAQGASCAIPEGSDPAVLAPILARQAHELALYGLKYVKEAAFVMVVIPPGFVSQPKPDQPVPVVHFYRRSDLQDELDRPVAKTFPDAPPTPATLTKRAADAIEKREGTNRYTLSSGTDASNTINVYTLTPI